MTIKSIDDIERENRLKEKEKMKDEIAGDIDDVFNSVRKKLTKSKEERKKKRGIVGKILALLFIIFAFIFVIDLVLGSVWLLKFFIQSLFNLK